MLEDVRAGRLGAVVAYAPDRLTRQPRELEDLVDLVERTGVRVMFCTAGEYRLDTADGRFHARMLGTVARMEAEKISERSRRAKLQRAQEGRWSGGGKRPFGFQEDGETVREDEAELIREACERLIAGDGLRKIARSFTSRGVATSFGGLWNQTTLRQILMSERIVGRRPHLGVSYKAVWPPLVDEATYQAVQAILGSRTATRPGTVRTYLLTGLVYCGVPGCGKALTSRGRKTPKGELERRYVCDSSRGMYPGCGGVSVAALPLELHVRAEVKKKGHGRKTPAGQQSKIAAGMRAFEERLEALDHAHYVEGKFSEGHYAAMREALEQKLRAGQAAMELPQPGKPSADEETLEARRLRVSGAVQRIWVDPTQKRGAGLDKGRVRIDWA
jgi:hypothetical protein